jgi:predicted metal-dependent phosphoesterase TrpH
VIDLHTHTTASDGRLAPGALVARAAAAGVTVLAVADHDTVAACRTVAEGCRAAGIGFVPGIEISAVRDDGDVHVLGYFLDIDSPPLDRFLAHQRRQRIDRLRQMIDRLAAAGIVLNGDEILRPALEDESKSAGRPWIARALVAGGHVQTADEAFDRWLERGRPGYVPRTSPTPEEVIARIHEAGGIASLAHPALNGHDEWIAEFRAAGLDALEAFHSDQDEADTARYLAMAAAMRLAVSGGSDFHGDVHGPSAPGAVALPREYYDALARRATIRATASGEFTSS